MAVLLAIPAYGFIATLTFVAYIAVRYLDEGQEIFNSSESLLMDALLNAMVWPVAWLFMAGVIIGKLIEWANHDRGDGKK